MFSRDCRQPQIDQTPEPDATPEEAARILRELHAMTTQDAPPLAVLPSAAYRQRKLFVPLPLFGEE